MGAARPGMPLRGCARRTGFESPYLTRPNEKRPRRGALLRLAVERVLRGGCSETRLEPFP